jgi:hypothetical protein
VGIGRSGQTRNTASAGTGRDRDRDGEKHVPDLDVGRIAIQFLGTLIKEQTAVRRFPQGDVLERLGGCEVPVVRGCEAQASDRVSGAGEGCGGREGQEEEGECEVHVCKEDW